MATRPAVRLRDVAVPGLAGEVSFDLAAGECVAITDPNPARTSLVRLIAGVQQPVAGTIEADRAVALWQDDGLPHDVPIGESARALLREYGVDQEPEAILARLGLSHRLEHEPWAMSVGERRRIATELVLCSGAPVIVLDEPERGLDRSAIAQLQVRLSEVLAEQRTVLIATHNTELADACADFVVDRLEDLTNT